MNLDFLKLLALDQQIILAAFVLFFLIQIIYYFTVFSRVAFYKHKGANVSEVSQDGISVVICAHNESEKLEELLPKVLEQGHPLFEVIVINDCSTDNSDDVLNMLSTSYPNLVVRTIHLDEIFSHNNSMAWGVGIRAAQYEWIVLTDVNCYPDDENWLGTLQQNFTKETEVVLSYTHIQNNTLLRAGNFADTLHYLSTACAHKPYTGSGENLAFRKSLFFENKGFHALLKLYDKADRIFINSVATAKNTVVDLTPGAINSSTLKISFKDWRLKRRDEIRSQRLFRKGTQYKGCFELVSRSLFYLLFIAALVFILDIQWAWITVLSLFVVRLFVQILIYSKAQKRLKEKGLLLISILWDIISPLIYLPIILLSKIERKQY